MISLLLLVMIVGTHVTLGTDKFEVTEGSGCTTNGACFQSLNYPNGNYGQSESCSVTVQSVLPGEALYSAAFNTESDYDKLVVKEVEYSGTSGPSNITLSVNDNITWSSDSTRSRSGFKVCLIGTCSETDGVYSNADDCGCGTATCSSSTGLFCLASMSTCSHNEQCSNKDGTAANSESCACGTSDCTSSTGLFCTSSTNTCSQYAACSVEDGTAANTGNCSCGTSECTNSTGLFCTAATNTCNTKNSAVWGGCLPGQFFNIYSKSIDPCQKCLPGQFFNRYSMSIDPCQKCPSGRYSNNNTPTPCETCNISFEPNANRTGCVRCAPGKYSDDDSVCKGCPSGKYSNSSIRLWQSTKVCADQSDRDNITCLLNASTWGKCADGSGRNETQCGKNATTWGKCADGSGRDNITCLLDASTWGKCADGSGRNETHDEVATSNKFVVTAGTGCTTNGTCFQSLNYPSYYGNSQSCSVTVQMKPPGERLYSAAFNTEQFKDSLYIKGVSYTGDYECPQSSECILSETKGPSGVAVAVGDLFTWFSDGSEQRSGFKVCLAGACSETDGSQANADACGCGTSYCTSSTGLFCTAATNTCRPGNTCTNINGSLSNSVDCACGTTACNDFNGRFCTVTVPWIQECADGSGRNETQCGKNASTWIQGCFDGSNRTETHCLMDASTFVAPNVCKKCGDHFEPNANRTGCVGCAQGKYSDDNTCKVMPNGKYIGVGYNLQTCNRGQQPNDKRTGCVNCTLGRYSDDNGVCKSCPTGKYSNGSAMTECETCGDHFESNANRTGCVGCARGQYSDDNDNGVCKDIPDGKYIDFIKYRLRTCNRGQQPNDKRTGCVNCTLGRYSDDNGVCKSCPTGKYSNGSAMIECETCGEHFEPNANRTGCAGCAPGHYSDDDSVCKNCPTGYYSNISTLPLSFLSPKQDTCLTCGEDLEPNGEQSGCAGCAPGRHLTMGEKVCKNCPEGRYSNSSTLSLCLTCGEHFEPNANRTGCVGCAPGQYSDDDSVCKGCPSGKYSNGSTLSLCLTCGNQEPNGEQSGCAGCAPRAIFR